ncbi:acyl-CoA synthetase [Thalassotalea euphylliae]|uniref:Acyl-CoA synthetase n=1 Tax=Thalassotalea euphylliae TaxID=1655234 RepID=A0A3E0TLW0_9GAMM|nr:acyl-CoA synthetase [Thalassotalea euphylliae]REL25506.1 acyl-CoA synthetase [Thalassotalea euphylliae]
MTIINIKTLNDVESLEQANPGASHSEFNNTYDAIKHSAAQRPDKTAISFFLQGDAYNNAHDISYQTLLSKITQAANFFDSIGLTENDVVAFFLPNTPEAHYVIWGGEARCQILAINPLLEPKQIGDLINSVQAKAVVTMNPMHQIELWPKLEQLLPELVHTEHVIGIDIAHHVTGPMAEPAQAMQAQMRGAISLPAGKTYHNFTAAIAEQNGEALNFTREYTDETISSLYCTGGTTGLPKIARRTHVNELSNVKAVQQSNSQMLNEEMVVLGGLPLFHVNGALVTGLLPFTVGGTVVIATPQGYREPNVIPNFWDIVEHHKVTTFSAVPTVYSALMNFPIEGKDLSSLKFGICGAAPMPVETFKSFQETTGIKILEGYGLTEGTCVSSLNPFHGEQKVGSIGLRLPYQQMKAVNIDGDKITRYCDTDEIGVLAVRGPNVFLGYQLEHQNKGLWLYDEDGNRWLNTGDLARQDEEGYFWLTGRKKELIVRAGHNIEPKLIEEAMCKHPAINLAAAVGKPDLHAGEVPVCYVQVENPSSLDPEELLSFAAAEISERAAIPKAIHIVEQLPVTAVGKVFKPQLEMQEIDKCITALASEMLPQTQASVSVAQDPKHGILASIELGECDGEAKAAFVKKLGEYTFKSSCN